MNTMPKKDICFVSMTNLFLCPYEKKYLEYFRGNDIDLIIWDRHNKDDDYLGYNEVFPYRLYMEEKTNKFKKLIYFNNFANFVKKILREKKYDRVVFLHNNVTLLMLWFLGRFYKNKYIIDIRDYTMEKNPVYFAAEKFVIKNSSMAVISSPGYKAFLPEHKYYISHNDCRIDHETIEKFHNREIKGDQVRISFIGIVRFFEQNIKLINLFANDSRFLLGFYGQNSDSLKEYVDTNGICNVETYGQFPSSQSLDFYEKTDIINNFYGNNSIVLKYALSNKLYYAATLGLPILVCDDTYMSKISLKYGFGIMIDESSDTAADDFYDRYVHMSKEALVKGGEAFLLEVEKDNEEFKNGLREFLR